MGFPSFTEDSVGRVGSSTPENYIYGNYGIVLVSAICLLVFWFTFRHQILHLLTPRGIPGIPSLPDSKPIWGDLGPMGKVISDTGSFSYWFDHCAQRMGKISQVRVGWWLKLVILSPSPIKFFSINPNQLNWDIQSEHARRGSLCGPGRFLPRT